MESRPADYLLPGTRLRRDGYFMLTSEVQRLDESPGPTDRSLVDHILKRYGSKRSDLHGHDWFQRCSACGGEANRVPAQEKLSWARRVINRVFKGERLS
jgi:hypothetical protein